MRISRSQKPMFRYSSHLLLSLIFVTSISQTGAKCEQSEISSSANYADIPGKTVMYEPVYEDDLVKIRFRYQPTKSGRHTEDWYVRSKIKTIVTNKSTTETLSPISFHYVPITCTVAYISRVGKVKDDCGNEYATEGVSPDSHGNLTIPPGHTRKFTVTFFGRPKADAKLLILSAEDGPFANTRSFEAGIPIKAGAVSGYVWMSQYPPPPVQFLGLH